MEQRQTVGEVTDLWPGVRQGRSYWWCHYSTFSPTSQYIRQPTTSSSRQNRQYQNIIISSLHTLSQFTVPSTGDNYSFPLRHYSCNLWCPPSSNPPYKRLILLVCGVLWSNLIWCHSRMSLHFYPVKTCLSSTAGKTMSGLWRKRKLFLFLQGGRGWQWSQQWWQFSQPWLSCLQSHFRHLLPLPPQSVLAVFLSQWKWSPGPT